MLMGQDLTRESRSDASKPTHVHQTGSPESQSFDLKEDRTAQTALLEGLAVDLEQCLESIYSGVTSLNIQHTPQTLFPTSPQAAAQSRAGGVRHFSDEQHSNSSLTSKLSVQDHIQEPCAHQTCLLIRPLWLRLTEGCQNPGPQSNWAFWRTSLSHWPQEGSILPQEGSILPERMENPAGLWNWRTGCGHPWSDCSLRGPHFKWITVFYF